MSPTRNGKDMLGLELPQESHLMTDTAVSGRNTNYRDSESHQRNSVGNKIKNLM